MNQRFELLKLVPKILGAFKNLVFPLVFHKLGNNKHVLSNTVAKLTDAFLYLTHFLFRGIICNGLTGYCDE